MTRFLFSPDLVLTRELTMDFRFRHPSNTLVVGSSGSGKTYLVKQIVENRLKMFDTEFVGVQWYYSEWQSIYQELAEKEGVEFIEGAPSMENFPRDSGAKLVICDDFMDEIKNNSEFLKLTIKGSHHRSLSLFILTQCLFPPNMRQISLQSHYCIIMKSVRDLAQIRTFCLQIDPKNFKALMEAYNDSTREGHTYLLFDFHIAQKDHLRLRTNILPHEPTVLYIPKSKYKSDMLEQTFSS